MRLLVSVHYVSAHFNRNAQANIPGVWEAEVIEGLPQPRHGHNYAYYVEDTREKALAGLIADLQARSLHGKIQIV
jgi:hypothetical protein